MRCVRAGGACSRGYPPVAERGLADQDGSVPARFVDSWCPPHPLSDHAVDFVSCCSMIGWSTGEAENRARLLRGLEQRMNDGGLVGEELGCGLLGGCVRALVTGRAAFCRGRRRGRLRTRASFVVGASRSPRSAPVTSDQVWISSSVGSWPPDSIFETFGCAQPGPRRRAIVMPASPASRRTCLRRAVRVSRTRRSRAAKGVRVSFQTTALRSKTARLTDCPRAASRQRRQFSMGPSS